jgi:hypothetical protein
MFIRESGETNIHPFTKTASTALSDASVVAFSSGELVAATSGINADAIAGVMVGAVVSTDPDYATASLKTVDVPRPRHDRFIADIGTGKTVAQSNVGTFCDLVDANSIDPATSTHGHVFIERLISTTGGANGTGQVVVSFPSTKSA